MKIIFKKKYQTTDGYAILFTVALVSIISVIALGLTNAAYKEIILSSVAKDSETAFYQADTASECALYADNQTQIPVDTTITSWTCGLDVTGVNQSFVVAPSTDRSLGYSITPQTPSSPNPCFNIAVTKTAGFPSMTTIASKGYNTCNTSNIRTVERQINASY
jgi:hypothetical protein